MREKYCTIANKPADKFKPTIIDVFPFKKNLPIPWGQVKTPGALNRERSVDLDLANNIPTRVACGCMSGAHPLRVPAQPLIFNLLT